MIFCFSKIILFISAVLISSSISPADASHSVTCLLIIPNRKSERSSLKRGSILGRFTITGVRCRATTGGSPASSFQM